MNTFRSPDTFSRIQLFAQMHAQMKRFFFLVLPGKSQPVQDFRSRQAATNAQDYPLIHKALLLGITKTAEMIGEVSLMHYLY